MTFTNMGGANKQTASPMMKRERKQRRQRPRKHQRRDEQRNEWNRKNNIKETKETNFAKIKGPGFGMSIFMVYHGHIDGWFHTKILMIISNVVAGVEACLPLYPENSQAMTISKNLRLKSPWGTCFFLDHGISGSKDGITPSCLYPINVDNHLAIHVAI